ncbi:lysosome membrane protein 2-like [Dendronephthya gigantea]|uniref:lysosome membrane protein 2-like n=1 Tax=Dendronephthya gigantea TaxID=151771 RepID=UPI00106D299F|nr:lysosome membrane protein 2-like [Dendronephthya gigantea]
MKGDAPVVIEKGPYSYRESRQKFNISRGHDKVNYNQITNYKFDPSTSCSDCGPNDYFTSVNIPYVTILQKVKGVIDELFTKGEVKIIDEILSGVLRYIHEDLFQNKTVNETIWGYEDAMFEDYNKLRDGLVKRFHFLQGMLPNVSGTFALQPNPNYDKYSTINTGESDVDKVGCYEQWNNNFGHLGFWNSPYANMLNGTDGSVYKPDISKDDMLFIFIIQLCRSLNVEYLDEVTIEGIDGYRFHPPKYLFQSGNINPDNKGFCVPNCLPSGLLSISSCVPFQAPIVVSSPHFLNGDKSLLKMIHGLSPNEEKHDTFLSLEPNTGILLQASKRIQFNIQVDPMAGIQDLENVKSAQIPIMWIDEHVRIDSSNAQKVKKNVLNNLEIIKWVELGLIILGGLMVLIAIILFIRLACSKNNETRLKLLAEEKQEDYGTNGDSGHLNPSLINASD